jgi:hypothetical protein
MKNIFCFIFLNIYSFFLFGLGVAAFLMPIDIFILVFKYLVVIWCIVGASIILSKYNVKIRQLAILVNRNKEEIRPDTFKVYLKTPCGQLLVNMAINNLRKTRNYANLSIAEWKKIKHTIYGKKFGRKPKKHNHFQKEGV